MKRAVLVLLVVLAVGFAAAVFIARPTSEPSPVNRDRVSQIAPDDIDAWKASDALAPEPSGKPWLEDAARSERFTVNTASASYSGRRPSPEGLLAGCSDLRSEKSAAKAAARASAARQLTALLAAHAVTSPREQTPGSELAAALDSFQEEVRKYVERNTADSFEQKIPREYGDLYRAAVLVRAGEKELGSFQRAFRSHLDRSVESRHSRRLEILITVASALALAMVVFLLYAFVNAGTKGHFAWSLRIISATTLLVLYLGWMYLKGWIRV